MPFVHAKGTSFNSLGNFEKTQCSFSLLCVTTRVVLEISRFDGVSNPRPSAQFLHSGEMAFQIAFKLLLCLKAIRIF